MERTGEGRIAYHGHVTWQPIPRDESGFRNFLGDVLAVLEQPAAGQDCPFCTSRQRARQEDS